MTQAPVSSWEGAQSSPPRGPSVPTYASSSSQVSAIFADGTCLEVARTRLRRYPGLRGPAPATRGIYAAVAARFAGLPGVVDLGCGAGEGLVELSAQIDRVTGLDLDAAAVRFAKSYVPWANVQQVKPEPATVQHPVPLVTVVDVLGLADSPVAVLRAARRLLGDQGQLVVAEPRASAAQILTVPQRRAFSPAGIGQLLTRAGFGEPDWVDLGGAFLACVAAVDPLSGWTCLEAAEHALGGGDAQHALALYLSAGAQLHPATRLESQLGAAMALAHLGDIEGACERLLSTARQGQEVTRACVGLSEISQATGDSISALSLAVQALAADPTEPAAAAALAVTATVLGQSDALAAWRIANALDPTEPSVAVHLAEAAAGAGDLGLAIWVLERLREFGAAESLDLHVTCAWLYVMADRLPEARLEVQLGKVLEPQSAALEELEAAIVAAEA